MISLIKGIIQSLIDAREFEFSMRMMDSRRNLKDTIKIKATKEQIGILKMCASYGISDTNDLQEKM